jgi:hypothetical protein
MEELVARLIGECHLQEAVAMSTLENGMQVFAYPLPDHRTLLALGVGPDAALTGEELLARRSARLEPAGGWLPSMFNDGSLYLLRRLDAAEEEGGALLAAQLDLALDMLN